ncbi:osmosensor SHO1 ASCRUDRAFT_29844 [Ascoidea rubescens DSM 1968]|uniref:High osmolarity signaling protein SHO1 n=1 Tax=Ascoidea rubescens DSM 1968 TaxID=1344418 RepID=A0A1D2VRM0_9ASCO|nr:hypothetical protein ASCRUDRAFT_29844 [Ascoidea rubescens DSM 1968]ODV64240.1 hypothetical protein ASCRUDRAFT_29844 [Ascoidea rubescens DSM 1968]
MLNNNPYNSNNHSFDLSYIATDPFAISTLSLAYLSWIIALAGSVSTTFKTSISFPRFTWWGLAFEFTLIVSLTLFYCFNLVDSYRNFLSSAFAVAFVYTTNSTNTLVYVGDSTTSAASAGVILLSMINIIWVFYFGSDNYSPINQWIDSYSLRRQNLSLITNDNIYNMNHQSLLMKSANNNNSNNNNNTNSLNPNLSNIQNNYNSNTFSNNFSSPYNNNNDFNTDLINGDNNEEDTYPYRAIALYNYDANPDDINEISFKKGEILQVNDIQGRWWQAKREDGSVGICPSNYVELVK